MYKVFNEREVEPEDVCSTELYEIEVVFGECTKCVH